MAGLAFYRLYPNLRLACVVNWMGANTSISSLHHATSQLICATVYKLPSVPLSSSTSTSISTFVLKTPAANNRFSVFGTACPLVLRRIRQGHACLQRANYNTSQANQSRVKKLLIATYVSGAVGAALFVAIGYRAFGKLKKSARGIEEIDEPSYSRRKKFLCRYRGYVLPEALINTITNDAPWFQVREDDIWVLSFPKAGTTWLEEIVYLIVTDFDYESAASATIEDRFPYLEYPLPGLKTISARPSPRFIKSHLPFSLLPKGIVEKKPKIIYIARNPKDTAVSLEAFMRLQGHKRHGTAEEFGELFLKDYVIYGPWAKHVEEAWEQRNEDNILFITYEDLTRDFKGMVNQIAKFLGKSVTESQLADLKHHTSFCSMQNNDNVNYTWYKGFWDFEGTHERFMRKGKVGDWKNHFSPELASKFDALTARLETLGLTFVDQLEDSEVGDSECVAT